MKFQLREYQSIFVDNVIKDVYKNKRTIACAATGSGKTKCFVSLASRAVARNYVVLIITDAIKIFGQIKDEGISGQYISAGTRHFFVRPGDCCLAMAQTLVRRPAMIQNFHFFGDRLIVIVDEAHVGNTTKILEQLPDAHIIGFTATPDARKGRHLPKIYKSIVIGPQPAELVNAGYLSPYHHFSRVQADLDALSIQAGEYTEESQEVAFDTPKVVSGIIDDLKHFDYKKCLIFCASIKHAETLSSRLTQAGFRNICYHSQTNTPLAYFTEGDVDICVSVGILTKGFDFPAIDLVVLCRATTSLPLFNQMCGRGSRLCPESGKIKWAVVDYGNNWKRHKTWIFTHDWSNLWWNVKPKKEGPQQVVECPECHYLNKPSAMVCAECGCVLKTEGTPEGAPDEDDGPTKLVEVTALYNKIRGKLISQLNPAELALYAKHTNKRQYAVRIARAQEQKAPGFLAGFALAMGYKRGWADHQQLPAEPIEFYDNILK